MRVKDFGSEFGDLLQEQKVLIAHYEEVVSAYQKSDIHTENIRVKKDLDNLKVSLEEIKIKYHTAEKEIDELKASLRGQMISEKTQLLTSAKEKMEVYFERAKDESNNRLIIAEQSSAIEIQKAKKEFLKKLGPDFKEFEESLNELKYKMNQKVMERTGELQSKKEELMLIWNKNIGTLEESIITPEMLHKRIKQNNIEVKIGLNWISKAGVLLILIGVITAMKYSYSLFSAGAKGIFGMLIGLVLLGIGENFNQKKKGALGTALTGGGIGTLYLTIFWSYFVLHIIALPAALAFSVLLSIAGFILSIRYNSKTIGAFALIGGYLPILNYISMGGFEGNAVYIGMGYVFVLNLVTILIAIKKDWVILKSMSFISHLPILLYLTYHSPNGTVAIGYTFLAFLVYLVMVLIYPLRFKQKLDSAKIIFLGANTFISSVVSYSLFSHFGFNEHRGLLALAFCVVYLGLNLTMQRYVPKEKATAILFGITALTFAVLVIPFQFGMDFVVLGWFIEGTLLIFYRSQMKSKLAERGGLIIFGLSVGSFIVLTGYYEGVMVASINMLDINYFVITVGMIGVMISYLKEFKKSMGNYMFFYPKGKLITIYKYITLFNFWIYLNYLVGRVYHLLGDNIQIIGGGDRLLLFVVITTTLAYALRKIPLLQDAGMRYVTIGMVIIVDALCVAMNLMPQLMDADSKGVGIFVLIIYNILVLFMIKDTFSELTKTDRVNGEIYPVVMAIYTLFNTTAVLKMQLDIGYVDFIISIFYVVSSFVLIIAGFKYRYRYIRYGGLLLSILATAKLFLFDARDLWEQYRIISYFCFGIVLIGISYLYQRFSKTMVLQENDIKGGDKE